MIMNLMSWLFFALGCGFAGFLPIAGAFPAWGFLAWPCVIAFKISDFFEEKKEKRA